MAREEQIQKLIDEEMGIDNYGSSDYQIGVCDGVRFADKTMIEKACEWISKAYTSGVLDWKNCDSIIEEFRKAMEE